MPRRLRAALAAAAVLVGALCHLVLQAGMMRSWPGWNLSYFRNYYWGDQLAYLSIATNVAEGESWTAEPYTITGANYYPRAWYVLLGYAARLTSTSTATMWTVGGLAAQVVLVCAIGVTCVLLTRRWWTGVLGFVPMLLGTGAWMLSSGTSWMTLLESHAVLWGPFAVLFTLNGETVALSLGTSALLLLLLVAAGRVPRRLVWPAVVVACVVVGLLANIQTYSFLVVTYVLATGTAAVGLVRARAVRAGIVTAGLVVVVLLAGPLVADVAGQLAVVVFGMLPTVPGLLLVGRATRWRAVWGLVALAVAASPQVLATAGGLVQDDPFLVYREASSTDLGVPLGTGLFAALGVLPALAVITVAGIRRRRVLWAALPPALALLWAYLASNDHWGANQEPYRFWLDSLVVISALTLPLLAWVVSDAFSREPDRLGPADRPTAVPVGAGRTESLATADAAAVHRPADDVPVDDPADDRADEDRRAGAGVGVAAGDDGLASHDDDAASRVPGPDTSPWSGRSRALVGVATGASLVVAGVWSYDFTLFRTTVTEWGYVPLTAEPYQAQVDLASQTDGGLVLPDGCVNPMIFKSTWGGPVAFYNLGLAWPDHKDDLDVAIAARTEGGLDEEAALRAGIRWLLVDPGCEIDLTEGTDAVLVDRATYAGGGAWELWRLGD
ncbi:hypothetical protein OMK64_17085 [Cellulomonas fimi]|uniref:hypothetical protein n=1 Tax=Cellulomonas fimi TaxID=1708 RepID=UPI00234D6222|nr:hypothetical protein [Cellulomonas fimi]MDC7123246.1 hypothetical protein [Cellulomonas fimi]